MRWLQDQSFLVTADGNTVTRICCENTISGTTDAFGGNSLIPALTILMRSAKQTAIRGMATDMSARRAGTGRRRFHIIRVQQSQTGEHHRRLTVLAHHGLWPRSFLIPNGNCSSQFSCHNDHRRVPEMETSGERGDPTGAVPPLAEPVGNGTVFREQAKISATFPTQGSVTCALRRDLIRDRTDQF